MKFNISICRHKNNYKHKINSHVNHDIVCHHNCNYEQHIEKGYSNTIINFFENKIIISLDESVKKYLQLMQDIYDTNNI